MNINRNYAFVVLSVLVAIAIIGSVVLRILRPDAEATFINSVMTMLGFISASLLILLGQNSTNKNLEETKEKLVKIERQTNGALHSRDETIRNQTELLVDNGIHPITGDVLLTRKESLAAEEKRR